jgi:hypothetical protein
MPASNLVSPSHCRDKPQPQKTALCAQEHVETLHNNLFFDLKHFNFRLFSNHPILNIVIKHGHRTMKFAFINPGSSHLS